MQPCGDHNDEIQGGYPPNNEQQSNSGASGDREHAEGSAESPATGQSWLPTAIASVFISSASRVREAISLAGSSLSSSQRANGTSRSHSLNFSSTVDRVKSVSRSTSKSPCSEGQPPDATARLPALALKTSLSDGNLRAVMADDEASNGAPRLSDNLKSESEPIQSTVALDSRKCDCPVLYLHSGDLGQKSKFDNPRSRDSEPSEVKQPAPSLPAISSDGGVLIYSAASTANDSEVEQNGIHDPNRPPDDFSIPVSHEMISTNSEVPLRAEVINAECRDTAETLLEATPQPSPEVVASVKTENLEVEPSLPERPCSSSYVHLDKESLSNFVNLTNEDEALVLTATNVTINYDDSKACDVADSDSSSLSSDDLSPMLRSVVGREAGKIRGQGSTASLPPNLYSSDSRDDCDSFDATDFRRVPRGRSLDDTPASPTRRILHWNSDTFTRFNELTDDESYEATMVESAAYPSTEIVQVHDEAYGTNAVRTDLTVDEFASSTRERSPERMLTLSPERVIALPISCESRASVDSLSSFSAHDGDSGHRHLCTMSFDSSAAPRHPSVSEADTINSRPGQPPEASSHDTSDHCGAESPFVSCVSSNESPHHWKRSQSIVSDDPALITLSKAARKTRAASDLFAFLDRPDALPPYETCSPFEQVSAALSAAAQTATLGNVIQELICSHGDRVMWEVIAEVVARPNIPLYRDCSELTQIRRSYLIYHYVVSTLCEGEQFPLGTRPMSCYGTYFPQHSSYINTVGAPEARRKCHGVHNLLLSQMMNQYLCSIVEILVRGIVSQGSERIQACAERQRKPKACHQNGVCPEEDSNDSAERPVSSRSDSSYPAASTIHICKLLEMIGSLEASSIANDSKAHFLAVLISGNLAFSVLTFNIFLPGCADLLVRLIGASHPFTAPVHADILAFACANKWPKHLCVYLQEMLDAVIKKVSHSNPRRALSTSPLLRLAVNAVKEPYERRPKKKSLVRALRTRLRSRRRSKPIRAVNQRPIRKRLTALDVWVYNCEDSTLTDRQPFAKSHWVHDPHHTSSVQLDFSRAVPTQLWVRPWCDFLLRTLEGSAKWVDFSNSLIILLDDHGPLPKCQLNPETCSFLMRRVVNDKESLAVYGRHMEKRFNAAEWHTSEYLSIPQLAVALWAVFGKYAAHPPVRPTAPPGPNAASPKTDPNGCPPTAACEVSSSDLVQFGNVLIDPDTASRVACFVPQYRLIQYIFVKNRLVRRLLQAVHFLCRAAFFPGKLSSPFFLNLENDNFYDFFCQLADVLRCLYDFSSARRFLCVLQNPVVTLSLPYIRDISDLLNRLTAELPKGPLEMCRRINYAVFCILDLITKLTLCKPEKVLPRIAHSAWRTIVNLLFYEDQRVSVVKIRAFTLIEEALYHGSESLARLVLEEAGLLSECSAFLQRYRNSEDGVGVVLRLVFLLAKATSDHAAPTEKTHTTSASDGSISPDKADAEAPLPLNNLIREGPADRCSLPRVVVDITRNSPYIELILEVYRTSLLARPANAPVMTLTETRRLRDARKTEERQSREALVQGTVEGATTTTKEGSNPAE